MYFLHEIEDELLKEIFGIPAQCKRKCTEHHKGSCSVITESSSTDVLLIATVGQTYTHTMMSDYLTWRTCPMDLESHIHHQFFFFFFNHMTVYKYKNAPQ